MKVAAQLPRLRLLQKQLLLIVLNRLLYKCKSWVKTKHQDTSKGLELHQDYLCYQVIKKKYHPKSKWEVVLYCSLYKWHLSAVLDTLDPFLLKKVSNGAIANS